MPTARGYATHGPKDALVPFSFERRAPRPNDVAIEILYCGVCHSDIHQARDEWGGSIFPMVPGHEIVGRVTAIGASAGEFRVGETVGVGCMVDSCRNCASCSEGEEQYCENGFVGTYNAVERDGRTPTFGGYADSIVVDKGFVLRVPSKLDPARAAPLLCAGITTYSPLRHWNAGPGKTVGVVGLGGLGHMGVKLACAFGAHVVVFTTSPGKREDALRLGAHEVVVSKDEEQMKAQAGRFDFILNTVAASIDLNPYLAALKRDGAMVLVGLPDQPPVVQPFNLVMKRRSLAGSLIGGIRETQEMLDFCAEKNVMSDIEMLPIQRINEAYERMIKGDVRYRFVIDIKSLGAQS